ncbi:Rap1-interacting factor 1 [Metarhizium album ARSEF 1941]|uniref:Rap1-interacting factor 1 n=1 Tax=Metarhizium album (strain ARSEF 1941) TaxID=1081103 RepID=A0A0B2WVG9_METAS|nr:Rap1-interacting factor 1 [Metarhizium album ARSEF 1941]KHN96895.1 Rap1-interacting factor 1 [Metarhizium album ARSEF 1941]
MASSVASASPINILIALPARPPTPPREASPEVDVSLKSVVLGRASAFDPTSSLHTPPNAHSLASPIATGSNHSSSRARKKVEWSSHTDYREAPQYPEGAKAFKFSPFSASSSATCSKPVKSILKPSPSPNPLASSTSEFHGSSPLNIIEMLDSTIKQLAGPDRDSKLDAYMMLSRALKASNNLPDRVALQDKMSLFMQFVQRDMTAKSDHGNLDTSLINHSLTLLATFLHFPAIASTLTADFSIFVIDHAIRSFEDDAMPKDVARHLMQVVAFQNFSAKVMTSERVGRLVTALHMIEHHLKGKSIVMSRLHIYKRLIKQSRNHMAVHLDWIKDMFTDMLSFVKDIRSQAISLGMEAGFELRSEKQLLRKATELFQVANDGETYIDFYIKRLQAMIKEKNSCHFVPQIWSVVTLFLRCPLDRWHHYGPWLTLVQSAFNMTDNATKQEANFAWNRYIYLSLSDSRVSPKCIATLCQPLLSQLRRKSSLKQQDDAMKLRRVVIGGICNLYYYAFTPGGDKYDIDVMWDVTVQPIIGQLICLDGKPDVTGDGIMQAARLLVGLLDVVTPRIWRQDRIVDLPPVKPDELPAIDSKWVRRNCSKVFKLVGPIIGKKFVDLANKESLIYRLWQAIVGSVTAASAKDIKVSEDTAKFVGCAFGFLSSIFAKQDAEPESASHNSKFLSSVSNFVHLLIDGLGLLPFTEKKLSMTVLNTFEPVSTPSQRMDRSEKPRGVIRMPLHHLFVMLAAVPAGCSDDDALARFLQSIFEPFLKGRTARGRLDLTKELLQLLPRNALSPYGPWLLAADCAKAYIDNRSPLIAGTVPTADKMNGPELREIVSLIERGLTSHPNLPPQLWTPLFDSVATHVSNDFGDAGCSLVVIEPLAKAIFDMTGAAAEGPSTLICQAVISLFKHAKLPRDRQAVEAARSRLWGAPPTLPKMTFFAPFDHLYKLGNRFLVDSYDEHLDAEWSVRAMPLLEAVDMFLEKNLSLFGVEVLGKLQTGLGLWLQDEKAHLQQEHGSLLTCVFTIWDHVCCHLAAQKLLKRQDLDVIEQVLTAAFKSTHATIVNRTGVMWNTTMMKDDENIECSDRLMAAISSVRSKIDIVVPGVSGDTSRGIQAPKGGPPIGDGLDVVSPSSSHPDASIATSTTRSSTSRMPMTKRRRLEMTPELHHTKLTKRMSTPRRRHDDSQIQFKPIASSPLHDESQHLTERQKEVRERQRQNALLYTDAQPSLSPPSAGNPGGPSTQRNAPAGGKLAQESTPKHGKSFEDLISSTPTPRRGQVFQMDDFNDPPSSPPAPRPCPLLSEIQSRSRAGSAMESWEFSSPPGSPVENLQIEDAELRPTGSADVEGPRKLRRSSKRKRRTEAEACQSTDQTDPNKREDKDVSSFKKAEDQSSKRSSRAPSTPGKGMVTRAKTAQANPKLEVDLSTGSKSLSCRRSSRRVEGGNKMTASKVDGTSKPGAVSDLRVAAHKGGNTLKPVDGSQSPDHNQGGLKILLRSHKSILVHSDSTCSSLEKPETATIETPIPVILSTEEPSEKTEATPSRRKRKRTGRHSDKGHKRRRSVGNEMEEVPVGQQKQSELPPPQTCDCMDKPAEGIQTRSGLRRQHSPRHESRHIRKDAKRGPKNPRENVDGGDTDEEVQSQLAKESSAASQQSHPDGVRQVVAGEEMAEGRADEDAMELETNSKFGQTMKDWVDTKTSAETPLGEDTSPTIMETLRSGLDKLRSASLSREKVYEVEDILMDMKRELFEAERRGRASDGPGRENRQVSKTTKGA